MLTWTAVWLPVITGSATPGCGASYWLYWGTGTASTVTVGWVSGTVVSGAAVSVGKVVCAAVVSGALWAAPQPESAAASNDRAKIAAQKRFMGIHPFFVWFCRYEI